MKWFSIFVLRKARIVAFIGTLIALICSYYSIQLYKNLRTDIHELLPTSARSVVDLKEVTLRMRSIDNLAVLVFSSHPEASKKFVIDLSGRLEKTPKDIIASVEYKIDQELEFFRSRQALYIDTSDLVKIKNYIRDRIEFEKELYNPLNIFKEYLISEPSLDFIALKTKYQSTLAGFDHLPQGYYATPDEKIRLVMAKLPGEATGITGSNLLKKTVEKAIQELKPKSYADDLEIKYAGDVETLIEEQTALVEDLETSTVTVTLLVTLGMLLFFRAGRATFALMLSLLVGTLWTFGVSYFVVGYLNANSAFLGSIIIGNGINFGIIYLARYLEERRNSRSPLRATRIAMIHAATPTWTAALAAGLSYGSLMLTGFRGFKQFGIIGLIGMILCWVSAFTVLPAYLVLLDGRKSLIRHSLKHPRAYIAGAIATLIKNHAFAITLVSLALTLTSLFTFKNFNNDVLETDLGKLRNRDSMLFGSAYLSKYVDEILRRDLGPIILLPKDRSNTRKIAALLKKKSIEEGDFNGIESVKILDDFVPKQQIEKIAILNQIRSLLNPRILKHLSVTDRKLVSDFLTPAVFQPIREENLPPLLLDLFREKDGSTGKMIIVDPRRSKHEMSNGNNLIRFVNTIRDVGDQFELGVPVAGSNAVVSDMIQAISTDGPKATLCAFIAVVLLVIVLFRNIKTVGLILFALILGVVWLVGIILGFHFKVNFLNFIALPITFGIGVDYGVNIFQRFQENKNEDILKVIKSAGSAVGLCSFSTITGYISLMIARNQGFVSFGTLAVAGELTCVVAALISLPALIYMTSKAFSKKTKTTL